MSQESADLTVLRAILDKLEKIEKLQALDAVKGMEKEQDKIELLNSLGYRPVDIAKLLGKTPENVSVVLGNIRKKRSPPSTPQQPVTTTIVAASMPAQT
jgi:hypothetical protein